MKKKSLPAYFPFFAILLLRPVAGFAQDPGPGIPTGRTDSSGRPIYKYRVLDPVFKGDLNAFLSQHLRYPDSSRRRGEEGQVRVRFAIDRKGRLVRPEIMQSSGYPLLDAEALRVLRPMQEKALWRPGRMNSVRTDLYISLPVTFTLD